MNRQTIYEQLAYLPYLKSYENLLIGAIQLDVFSHLETPISSDALAATCGWDRVNTLNLLQGLYSLSFVQKEGELFVNTADCSQYLVKGKPNYMGDTILFFYNNQGMNLPNVPDLVQNGPKMTQEAEQAMDFEAYGRMLLKAQKGIRENEVLNLVKSLPENKSIKRILDLGCAAGVIGLGIIKDEADRTGVLFDQPPMKTLIEETIQNENLSEKAEVMVGDFMTDSIGKGYDLILCSSIMLFASRDLDHFMTKIHQALNDGGVALCINEGIEPDYSAPWDMVLGYMTYNMMGMPMGMKKGQVAEAAQKAGFASVENKTLLLSTGTHDINILRKQS